MGKNPLDWDSVFCKHRLKSLIGGKVLHCLRNGNQLIILWIFITIIMSVVNGSHSLAERIKDKLYLLVSMSMDDVRSEPHQEKTQFYDRPWILTSCMTIQKHNLHPFIHFGKDGFLHPIIDNNQCHLICLGLFADNIRKHRFDATRTQRPMNMSYFHCS